MTERDSAGIYQSRPYWIRSTRSAKHAVERTQDLVFDILRGSISSKARHCQTNERGAHSYAASRKAASTLLDKTGMPRSRRQNAPVFPETNRPTSGAFIAQNRSKIGGITLSAERLAMIRSCSKLWGVHSWLNTVPRASIRSAIVITSCAELSRSTSIHRHINGGGQKSRSEFEKYPGWNATDEAAPKHSTFCRTSST